MQAGAWQLGPLADVVRRGRRRVDALRAAVTDDEAGWARAEAAAAIEREVFQREAELDAASEALRRG
jgi:hypothetical protein